MLFYFTIRPALPVSGHVQAIIFIMYIAQMFCTCWCFWSENVFVYWRLHSELNDCIREFECANHTQLVHRRDSRTLTAARKRASKVVE